MVNGKALGLNGKGDKADYYYNGFVTSVSLHTAKIVRAWKEDMM